LVERLSLPSDYFVMNSIVAIIIFIQGADFVSVLFDSDTVVKIARSDRCVAAYLSCVMC